MGLEERVYSVLVATAAESFRTALTELLPEASYSPVCFVSDAGAARPPRPNAILISSSSIRRCPTTSACGSPSISARPRAPSCFCLSARSS